METMTEQNSGEIPARLVPCCPDCNTELTKVRGRCRGMAYLHCWKCDRPMRLGEQRAAERKVKGL